MTTRWDQQLELYLDEQLNQHDRREFALRLNHDPDLRAQVSLQRHIDESLRAAFAVSPRQNADDLIHQIAQSIGPIDPSITPAAGPPHDDAPLASIARRAPRIFRTLGIAALLFISFASVWIASTYLSSAPSTQRRAVAINEYYQQKVQTGFKPYWVCETNEQFASAFRDRFGQPLLLTQPLPAGITAAGLDYCHTISPKTISVLMREQATPIVILIDRAPNSSPSHQLPANSGLHIHRRTIGDLLLHEVSPLPQPRMLDLFYNPDLEDKSSAPGKWQ